MFVPTNCVHNHFIAPLSKHWPNVKALRNVNQIIYHHKIDIYHFIMETCVLLKNSKKFLTYEMF